MRRIIAFNRVTADGYFSTPDGKLDWVVPDPELDKAAGEAISRGGTGTFLFGRRTYEMFASFWPRALKEPSTPDPHNPQHVSKEMHAMAVVLNETPKIVFSKTLKEATWNKTRIVKELDPRAIESMKAESGDDIMIFGSGSIASQLARHGLIDEYQFVVCPVAIGSGKSLLSGVPMKAALTLEESRQFPSGNVMLRYTRR